MNLLQKTITYLLLAISIFHTVRDTLQILHIENIISVSLHTSRTWCNPICDYITYPPELFIIFAAIVILRRKQFGMFGISMLAVFLIWATSFVYSWITK